MPPLPVRERAPLPRDPSEAPALDAAFSETLAANLPHLGITLTPGQRAAIEAHARLLLAWNDAINLTALRTPAQVARDHVVDSLTAVAVVHDDARSPRRRLLDLGSGGGYPGLPLAIVLGTVEAGLLDSIRKKAAFLEVAAAAATHALLEANEPEPGARAIAARAEGLAGALEHRGRWDLVTARAVGGLSELVELALPLLRVGGRLISWKRSPGLDAELGAARATLRLLRSDPHAVEVHLVTVPDLADHRLVVIRKTAPTPARFPRPVPERRREAAARP